MTAILEWPREAEDEDGYPAPDVVDDLTAALLACGRIAFRWDDDPPPGRSRRHPAPRFPTAVAAARAAIRWFAPELVAPAFDVVTTCDPAVARSLFSYGGWTWAAQAVIVYDPASDDPPDIVTLLQRRLDWRKEALPQSARLLFGPGHDGAFAIVAAATPACLDRFSSKLESA